LPSWHFFSGRMSAACVPGEIFLLTQELVPDVSVLAYQQAKKFDDKVN